MLSIRVLLASQFLVKLSRRISHETNLSLIIKVKTKVCDKCDRQFPLHVEHEGKMIRLYTRTCCLQCSPLGGHKEIDGHKTCSRCLQNKPSEAFYRGRNGRLRSWCNQCTSNTGTQRQKEKKLQAITYKGGKCQKCGYDRCKDSLQFHHLDPKKKEFRIATGRGKSWAKLKVELDKCLLVCANCHGEIHAGQ
jgi:hypothetical protein